MKEEYALFQMSKDNIEVGINELGETFQALQILPFLQERYPTELKKTILSIRFYQTEKACYLEVTEIKNPEKPEFSYPEEVGFTGQYSNVDYVINRESLAFIADENEPFFKITSSIIENTYFFLKEYDDWSMINTMSIFSKDGENQIFNRIKAMNAASE